MASMKPLFSETTSRFTMTAKVAPDRMKIFVEAKPAEGEPQEVTAKEINEILIRHVPQRLIHERVVEEMAEMLSRGEVVSERRIAKGEESQPGLDGKQVVMVKAYTQKPELTEDTRGFAQLNELHLFDNVQVGQVLARIYPPHGGADGFDAFGKILPSKPGKPFKPNCDKKTIEVKAAAGFETLNALVPGYLQIESGALRVVDDLVVSGNVDFHVGNIDFVGSVTIRGDVMPGFIVKAEKGIIVTGSVHKGTLLCRNGSIECRGSISGGDNGRVITTQSLKASVLHEVSAEVGGDLIVEKEARDSELFIEGALRGDTAVLLGGLLRTSKGVQVKQLGYHSGKETVVTLCSGIETRREFITLLSQIESHEKARHLLELHLGPLAKNPSRIQVLKEPHREKMEKLLEKLRSVSGSLDLLRGKKMKILQSSEKVSGLRVNILQQGFVGVKVHAGEHHYELKEEIAGPRSLVYDSDKGEFCWNEFVALEESKTTDKEKKNDKKK